MSAFYLSIIIVDESSEKQECLYGVCDNPRMAMRTLVTVRNWCRKKKFTFCDTFGFADTLDNDQFHVSFTAPNAIEAKNALYAFLTTDPSVKDLIYINEECIDENDQEDEKYIIFVQTEGAKDLKPFAVLKSQSEVNTMLKNIERRCEAAKVYSNYTTDGDTTIVTITSNDKRLDQIFYDPFEMDRAIVYTDPHKPEILDTVESPDGESLFLIATRSMDEWYRITQTEPIGQDFQQRNFKEIGRDFKQKDFKEYEIPREVDRELCNYIRKKLNEERILFSICILDYDPDLDTYDYLVILYTDMYASYNYVYSTFKELVENYTIVKDGTRIVFNIYQNGFDLPKTSTTEYLLGYEKADIVNDLEKWIDLKFDRQGCPSYLRMTWSDGGKIDPATLTLSISHYPQSDDISISRYVDSVMNDFTIYLNIVHKILSICENAKSIIVEKHTIDQRPFIMYIMKNDEEIDVFYEDRSDSEETIRYNDICLLLTKFVHDIYQVPSYTLDILKKNCNPTFITIESNQ